MQHEIRGNPFLKEQIHDPYHSHEKLRDATQCPECGVHYKKGRWTWPTAEASSVESQLCPACRRIKDRCPAGEVLLSGRFLGAHRDEILATARNVGEAERNEHPLHRIISIDEHDDEIKISTTDVHLPHRIAHALKDAWGGTMKTHYDLEGYFARVHWERDD
jgi:NMD protein affecting ribosome stability and mRNA decay